MAFVDRPTAELAYTMLDASGNTAKLKFHVPFDTLATVALTAADTLMALIGTLTNCSIISRTLTYSQVDDAPAAPAAGSRIENKGVFIFNLENGLKTRFEIPAIKESVLRVSGAINTSDLFVSAFVAGVNGVDAIFAGVDGSDITDLDSAYQRFRRSTRNMLPSDRKSV